MAATTNDTAAGFAMAAEFVQLALQALELAGQSPDNGPFGTVMADLSRIHGVLLARAEGRPEPVAQPIPQADTTARIGTPKSDLVGATTTPAVPSPAPQAASKPAAPKAKGARPINAPKAAQTAAIIATVAALSAPAPQDSLPAKAKALGLNPAAFDTTAKLEAAVNAREAWMAKQGQPAPKAAETAKPAVAAQTAKPEVQAPKAPKAPETKPAAKPAAPAAPKQSAYRQMRAEAQALGLDTAGTEQGLTARIAEFKAAAAKNVAAKAAPATGGVVHVERPAAPAKVTITVDADKAELLAKLAALPADKLADLVKLTSK